MIRVLRHVGIHLWICTLIAVPSCFFILAGLTRFFPGIHPVPTGLGIIVVIIIVTGVIMDATAKRIVKSLIKEGQTWERSGILKKAEKNYMNAVRIYDTFLLWPFTEKKIARNISGAVSKFQLNTSIDNENFKSAAPAYLKLNPEDIDMAELWLNQLRQSRGVTSLDQDVLSVLAEKYAADQRISILLADIFLELERRDFTAARLYQTVLKMPAYEEKYAKRVENIIGTHGNLIQNDVYRLQPEKSSHPSFDIGKKIGWVSGQTVSFLKWTRSMIGSTLLLFGVSVSRGVAYFKGNEKSRFYLKTVLISGITAWLLFFMISTLSHMFQSNTVKTAPPKIEIQVPMPFTIQVAAYLKQEHADRYVAVLKKNGIDARVKKVDGGGKTWFVVRISQFVDKKSAAEYGQKLIREKIIEDFFVNNK